MESEAVIRKYDFIHGTGETESSIADELGDLYRSREYMKSIDLPKFKKIVAAYTEKVCVKGYPATSTSAYWMAKCALRHIQEIKSECCEEGNMAENEAVAILFQLYVDMLLTGPGTTHCELLDELREDDGLQNYLKSVTGNDLLKVVNPFKEISYTEEPKHRYDDDEEDDDEEKEDPVCKHCSVLDQYLPRQMNVIMGNDDDDDRAKQAENWDVFVDLYMSFVVQSTMFPEPFGTIFEYCQDRIADCYDKKNPYLGYHNMNTIKNHLATLEKIFADRRFPQHKRAQEIAVTTAQKIVLIVTGDMVIEIWDDLLKFMRALLLSKIAEKVPEIISACRSIVSKLDEKTVESHPKLFETWAPVMAEILEGAKQNKTMDGLIDSQVYHMTEHVKPAKDYDKLWIPILKGLILWPWKESYQSAVRLIKENKWKRTWNWKKNVPHAKEIITRLGKVDLPTVEEGSDSRHIIDKGGDIVEAIMEQLNIVKIGFEIQAEVGELVLTLMERRSDLINRMTKSALYKVDMQKCQEVIPGLLARFEVLVRDEDYPWLEWHSGDSGIMFLECCLAAYNSGKDIPDEVNERFISIILYVSNGDKEIVDLTDGRLSFFGKVLLAVLYKFMNKHEISDTLEETEPLIPLLFEWIEKDEHDDLTEVMDNCFRFYTEKGGKVLALYMDQLMDTYIQNHSMNILQCLTVAYDENPGPLADKFDQLIDAFIEDTTQVYILHALFLKKVAELQPELFTDSVMSKLMDHHFVTENVNAQMLLTFEVLVETNAAIFAPYLESKFYNNPHIIPYMGHQVVKIVYKVAVTMEEYKKPAFDYFLNTFKKSTDPTQMHAMVNGLRELAFKYGPEMFESHKQFFEEQTTSGIATYVKDAIVQLLDVLEGRSLKKVSEDVDETKKDVEKLNISVAGTKVVLKRVQRDVRKYDRDIKQVKTGLNEVNERVDGVEQDLEETKQKVEEVDKKTMSNAPVWSRDLTKLMNPEAKADWRLLASRLGYSRDDIKGWATQSDPCMALLSEWYATHKTVEATHAVLLTLQEIHRLDGATIVENAMKAVDNVVPEDPVDYVEPPQVFLSYQWGHQNEVKLIRKHLEMAGYTCWMDIGQMGGGDKLFEKIDAGIRGAKIVVACVTTKYAKSPNCIREVNLSVTLGKPIIPLLLEKISWPPPGSMGPIFSEYIFIRFFQRTGEETNDERVWPEAKFVELLMQLNYLNIMPNEANIAPKYKAWWKPIEEAAPTPNKNNKTSTASGNNSSASKPVANNEEKDDGTSPEVFISYQWGKQKEISALYKRLSALGLHCWMDIHQMGGGDSLYDKIDRGIRGSKVVLSSVTPKYALSMNCRREVSLADALKKPIIPMLMDKMVWPPDGPMSMPLTQLIYINFTKDDSIQQTWKGQQFDELMTKIRDYIPDPNSKTEGKKITERESNSTVKDTPHSAKAVAVKEGTKEVSSALEIPKPNSKTEEQNKKPESKSTSSPKEKPESAKDAAKTSDVKEGAKTQVPQKNASKPTNQSETKEDEKSDRSKEANGTDAKPIKSQDSPQGGQPASSQEQKSPIKQQMPAKQADTTTPKEEKKKSSTCVLL